MIPAVWPFHVASRPLAEARVGGSFQAVDERSHHDQYGPSFTSSAERRRRQQHSVRGWTHERVCPEVAAQVSAVHGDLLIYLPKSGRPIRDSQVRRWCNRPAWVFTRHVGWDR